MNVLIPYEPHRASGALRNGLALLSGATLAVLAACAPRTAPPAPPPPPPVTEAKPEPEKLAPVHRVAVLVPLSGANAPVGTSLANAATLALADTGKAGLQVTNYDTAALGAAVAAQRAMAEGAELILGPLLASEIPAVRSVAAPRNITMLSFSNDVAAAGGNVYILGFQPAQSVSRVVDYASERGFTRFAGLIPGGVYGQRASVAFTRAVNANNGRIVALTEFSRNRSSLPAAARKVTDYDARLKTAGGAVKRPDGTIAPVTTKLDPVEFDALLVADSGVVAGGFAPLLERYGAPAGSFLMMGTELWGTEPNLRSVPSLHGAVFAAVPDQRFRAMASRYRERFGGTPSRLASLSYDAMLLAASVAGGGWKVEQPFPAAVLQDRQGFAGIDGIFRFDGNIATRGLEVRQVGSGGFTTVSPAPTSFGH
ncbi:MAG: penicillin-binding protein activator [Sphingomonadaceae bacterium]